MRRFRPIRAGALVLAAVLPVPASVAPARAQEPDSARVQEDTVAVRDSVLVADSALLTRPRAERCVLQWEPLAPDTEGLSLREGGEAHVTHVSGRMLWTCGTATMEADSAVKYDRARRVDLIGNVVYGDTTRTLRSRFLTYFELQDLVIATGEVELERIGDGSTLEGPRVEFLRAVSGIDELTIATGRPHMRLYPEGEDRTNPFEIDADRAVFAGEEEARVYGDVIIAREDLNAEADSANLRRIDETGVLWGSPWVDAEGVRLAGDTIRFASEEDELRDVHALGNGHAIGESFEVRAEKIDVELVDREVEAVWAHGAGASEAVSGAHHVYGDSLRFVMFAGGIDTLYSVGEAAAVQADGPVAVARLDPSTERGQGGAADTIGVETDSTDLAKDGRGVEADSSGLASDSSSATPTPAVEDTAAAPGDTTAAREAEAAPDTVTDPEPGPVAEDTTAAIRDTAGAVVPAGVPPDSMAALSDSTVVPADSADAGAPADSADAGVEPSASESGSIRPRMSVDGRSNWVRGDTLIAIFERDSLAARDGATAGLLPAADSLPGPAAGDTTSALPSADSLSEISPPGGPPPAVADTASDPRMERLIVIGNASSFYRQVRDTARTSRPSRNYMIGKRIDVLFEAGEPKTVKGTEAIGIYLEPEEGVAGEEAGAPADTGAPGPDSLVVRDSALVLPDSLRPDSMGTAPDSSGVPRDSASAPPDSANSASGRRGLAARGSDDPAAPVRPLLESWLRRSRP